MILKLIVIGGLAMTLGMIFNPSVMFVGMALFAIGCLLAILDVLGTHGNHESRGLPSASRCIPRL